DTENQRLELGQAGWQIDYWFADVVSGKVPAMQRKAFSEMLNKTRELRLDKITSFSHPEIGTVVVSES
ncbi:hypothetical protein ACSLPB_11475, partial [Escherichia coli]